MQNLGCSWNHSTWKRYGPTVDRRFDFSIIRHRHYAFYIQAYSKHSNTFMHIREIKLSISRKSVRYRRDSFSAEKMTVGQQ